MIILFENPDNNASVIYDVSSLTEVEKAKGITVEQLPTKEEIEGKQAILKCRKSTNEVWYQYEAKPIDEIAELKQQINDLNIAMANLMGV